MGTKDRPTKRRTSVLCHQVNTRGEIAREDNFEGIKVCTHRYIHDMYVLCMYVPVPVIVMYLPVVLTGTGSVQVEVPSARTLVRRYTYIQYPVYMKLHIFINY